MIPASWLTPLMASLGFTRDVLWKMQVTSLKTKKLSIGLNPYSDKSAKFVAAIALVNYEKFPQVFIGEVKGLIIDEPHGESGFGYDPIFSSPN